MKFLRYGRGSRELRNWAGCFDDRPAILPVPDRPGWFFDCRPIAAACSDAADKNFAPTDKPGHWLQFRDPPLEIEKRFAYSSRGWRVNRDGIYYRTTACFVSRELRFELVDWADAMDRLRRRPLWVVKLFKIKLNAVIDTTASAHKSDLA